MKRILSILLVLLLLTGCGASPDREGQTRSYRQIGMEEAVAMMEEESGYILLDVRTPEEHKIGYLEGAVLLPLAELESKISSKVADKNTPVYIYCRSGRRAGTAVETLKAMGYTDLHNLGGLKDAREKLNIPIKK